MGSQLLKLEKDITARVQAAIVNPETKNKPRKDLRGGLQKLQDAQNGNPELTRSRDLGMWVLNRGFRLSCKWRTQFCNRYCYNNKFTYMYGLRCELNDVICEMAWACCSAKDIAEDIACKPGSRFRFAAKGEMLVTIADISKIAEIIKLCPDKIFWLPTRAWRDTEMRQAIEAVLFPLPNVRVMASTDPSNTSAELATIPQWSTMFFGNNAATQGRFLCPKTWSKARACATCEGGCFSTEQIHIHLKKH